MSSGFFLYRFCIWEKTCEICLSVTFCLRWWSPLSTGGSCL
jgi:hypothetical protein